MSKVKYVISFFSVILASVYLTFLIDTYTLNTPLKRVFVFCYFAVISCLALRLYNKAIKRKVTLIPLICAVIVAIIGQNVFLPTVAEHTVYLQAIKTSSGEEKFMEVWFVDLEVDGAEVPLSKLQANDALNWSYSKEFDDYYFKPLDNGEENANNVFSFTAVGKEIKLIFGANTWSGSVRIFDGAGYDEKVSLYSEDAANDRLEYTLNAVKQYTVSERVFYTSGAVAVVCFFFKVLIGLVSHFIGKRKTGSKTGA